MPLRPAARPEIMHSVRDEAFWYRFETIEPRSPASQSRGIGCKR